jgi:hypothetical protein
VIERRQDAMGKPMDVDQMGLRRDGKPTRYSWKRIARPREKGLVVAAVVAGCSGSSGVGAQNGDAGPQNHDAGPTCPRRGGVTVERFLRSQLRPKRAVRSVPD